MQTQSCKCVRRLSYLPSCWKWEDQHLLLCMHPHPLCTSTWWQKKKKKNGLKNNSSKYFQSTSSYPLISARHHLVAKTGTLWTEEQRTSLEQMGFPCGSVGKESACNAGDPGLILESGRSPGVGKGYSHSSILARENSMDCRVQGVAKSRTRLSNFQSKELRTKGSSQSFSASSWWVRTSTWIDSSQSWLLFCPMNQLLKSFLEISLPCDFRTYTVWPLTRRVWCSWVR